MRRLTFNLLFLLLATIAQTTHANDAAIGFRPSAFGDSDAVAVEFQYTPKGAATLRLVITVWAADYDPGKPETRLKLFEFKQVFPAGITTSVVTPPIPKLGSLAVGGKLIARGELDFDIDPIEPALVTQAITGITKQCHGKDNATHSSLISCRWEPLDRHLGEPRGRVKHPPHPH